MPLRNPQLLASLLVDKEADVVGYDFHCEIRADCPRC